MKFIFNELLIEIFNSDFSNVPFDNKTFQKFYSLLMLKNIIQSTKIKNVCTTSKIAEFEKSLRNAELVVALFNSDGTRNLFEYKNIDNHSISEHDFVLMNDNDNLYNLFKQSTFYFSTPDEFFEKNFRNLDIIKIDIQNHNFHAIENNIPVNSLLIVDCYFALNAFESNWKLFENLISFFQKESCELNLSIIYGKDTKESISNILNRNKEYFEENKISIQCYRIPGMFNGDQRIKDRYFFTNYTYSVIGHPIQNLKTYFAQKMIFNSDTVEDLDTNLLTYKTKLNFFKEKLKAEDLIYSLNCNGVY